MTRNEFGQKRIHVADGCTEAGVRYQVDPELLKLVQTATTESGETDTAKWMTGVEQEKK